MERRERVVRLEPAVPEAWIAVVVEKGVSPNALAEWILRGVDLEEWLGRFADAGGLPTTREPDARPAAMSAPEELGGFQSARSVKGEEDSEGGWSKSTFFDFLEVATSVSDLEWSMALLAAYLRLGPMPTSEQLQELCGFSRDHAWQQELRVAKQRLTLSARRMDAPPLFPRAKSTPEGERLHPIEPRLFPWLREWVRGRQEGDGGIEGGGLPRPEKWGPAIEKSNKYEEAKNE